MVAQTSAPSREPNPALPALAALAERQRQLPDAVGSVSTSLSVAGRLKFERAEAGDTTDEHGIAPPHWRTSRAAAQPVAIPPALEY